MKKAGLFLLVLPVAVACKKPYNPNVAASPKSYLVVEGVINTNDTTTVKLSRSVNLASVVTSNSVEGTVKIESDAGGSYPLISMGKGIYKLSNVTLSDAHKYRLFIHANDNGNEYRSDFTAVKNAPPIDSIGFTATIKGIHLYLNSHDDANNTHYYRHEYWETWQFHARYASQWKSNGVDDMVVRPESEQITYCFQSNLSSTIILASTAKLSRDVVYQLPITEIGATSEKLEAKYSILVRQYALTAEAYKFWENLKKNTEQLGSIFDAEPTQLAGNIHNINDNTDIVIGFVSVGSVATKRVFITNQQLPFNYIPTYPYDCHLDSFYYDAPKTHVNSVLSILANGTELGVSAIYIPHQEKPIGYGASSKECVDCTIRGTVKQPDFWR